MLLPLMWATYAALVVAAFMLHPIAGVAALWFVLWCGTSLHLILSLRK